MQDMKTGQIIDILSKTVIFRGLPPHFLASIADQVRFAEFKPQEIVIKQSQKVNNFYIISSGRLEVYIKDQRSVQTHVSYLLPNDYFGDFYLLYDQPSVTEIIAVERTKCLYLPKEEFLSLLDIDPEISQHILRSMLQHLHKTNIAEEAAKYKETALHFLQQGKKTSQFTILIGKSKTIQDANAAIERFARNDDPLLLEGEYGTGKELVARLIHNKSARAGKPLISVDCEKLTPDTLNAQLFGSPFPYSFDQRQYGTGFSYMELAEGGAILIKNIEVLPLEAQVRIHELLAAKSGKEYLPVKSSLPNVRIIATTRIDLKSRLKNGQFDQRLFEMLSVNKILLAPLRERKRDIPDLVDHLIKKYAAYYQKNVDKVSNSAISALLGHDYRLSNLQELEEIISRAVNLTRSDTVRSEHLFLGLPATKPLVLFNLLRLETFASWVKKRIFPEKIRHVVAIVFLVIIGLSIFSHKVPYPYNNIGKVLTWSFWWPAMFISFFFIGRFWCSICPYATYSHIAKKVVYLDRNFPFKKYDYLFMTFGFLFVIWVEEVSSMRESSFKVGLLQISILTLAIIMGIVYKRDSWCRFVCPLGALISTCSMTSMVEVRSNPDVCLNQCATHDCYKGSKDIPGCPMFQHLMYVDNNQTCKICLNCVRSCSHDNISLNIRPPATEIYSSNQLNKGLFLFVISLLGILIPILLLKKHIITHHILPFTMIYLFTPLVILFALWTITGLGFRGKETPASAILWRSTYAYIPLALTAHIAYQLQFLPVVDNLLFSVLLSPSISANIVIYSKTMFYLFKAVYLFFEFIIYFKLVTFVMLEFKKSSLKTARRHLIKPITVSLIIGATLYFLPKINSHIFSLLRPKAESTNIVYSIPLFHIFQLMLMISGIILSIYCMFRILNKYKDQNLKKNKALIGSHLLFMILYSLVLLILLVI
ncbi:sigma 54-interacting transcriptional regulator [bacterium]|nr:sigma 54-interacting transcriptional regulator [bacterium]